MSTSTHYHSLAQVAKNIRACTQCPLHETRTHAVPGNGDPHATLILIGEGPGKTEDAKGEPFVGKAGKLLTHMLEAIGLTREQVFITNIVKCRPPKNRNPHQQEIAACVPYLKEQLRLIQPRIICTLGASATSALLGKQNSITHVRGQWFDYHGIKLMPTFHPAYLLYNRSKTPEMERDFQEIMQAYQTG
ncbi:uracil-DNA glycosylase [candidate division KSB3 bacterium]|uniref:Type-4 uracil-DNA glycosylase n=1 Tax=candidate division KSB3 bacterium TaxID=2044937 RepID=A0A9D5JZ76_9BACT|nr:uracil-DNA glycosylase [candidate division KSB3 bacterium]MBD3326735.1 uracil-DNA glycosylase [candidate division KSB3 bacterium]